MLYSPVEAHIYELYGETLTAAHTGLHGVILGAIISILENPMEHHMEIWNGNWGLIETHKV